MQPKGTRRAKSQATLAQRHTPDAISRALGSPPRASNLRDFIYGAIDGTVTTFAIVAGVAGAQLSAGIVVVLGLANLLADGLSMAVSNFTATRAEGEEQEVARLQEEYEIAEEPEGEQEEIRQIFAAKGFEGADLERVVEVITSDRDVWVRTMLAEEYGFGSVDRDPLRAASITFGSFVVVGSLPLITFIVEVLRPGTFGAPFLISTLLSGAAFFVVGALKSWFVGQSWWRSGLETLVIGGAAATVAYLIGRALQGLVG